MNRKKSKNLKLRASGLMTEYIRTRVLSEKDYEELIHKCLVKASGCKGADAILKHVAKQMILTLPEKLLVMKERTMYNAIGTQRYFIRMVKKYPNITYEQLDKRMYK